MDIQNRRQAIQDMLNQLRDEAIAGVNVNKISVIHWKKTKHNVGYQFVFPEHEREYAENRGMIDLEVWENRWLEGLYRGIKDGYVQAVPRDQNDNKLTPTNGDEPSFDESSVSIGTQKRRPRIWDVLRDEMINVIETKIGRPIVSRTPKPIDPRQSDEKSPNFYRWGFSDQYPGFPDRKGGISRWSAQEIRDCHKALEDGQLSVIVVDPEAGSSAEEDEQPAVTTEEEDQFPLAISDPVDVDSTAGTSADVFSAEGLPDEPEEERPEPFVRDDVSHGVLTANEEEDETEYAQKIKRELEDIDAGAMNSHKLRASLVAINTRVFEDSLEKLIAQRLKECRSSMRSNHAARLGPLRVENRELKSRLNEQSLEHQKMIEDTLERMKVLERENQALRIELEKDTRDTEKKLLEAEEFGKEAGRRAATKIHDEIVKQMTRTHMVQIAHAREEGKKAGIEVAKAEMTASLSVGNESATSYQELSVQLQLLEETQANEIRAASEGARREGRRAAYKELGLDPDEKLNNLTGASIELGSNRKVRELRTISQNWGDVPQIVLPHYMLPEGHTPGDKTLYLLAKLSKETDKVDAATRLKIEIERRTRNLPADPKGKIVTNVDIRNVLEQIARGQSTRNTILSEPSATPQTQNQVSSSAQPIRPTHSCNTPPRSENTVPLNPAAVEKPPIQRSPPPKPSAVSSQTSPSQRVVGFTAINLQKPHKVSSSQLPVIPTPPFDILKALRDIPRSNIQIPSPLQIFTGSFFRDKVGGGDARFNRVALSLQKKQLVNWPEIIKITQENDDISPDIGSHGAMAFVDGKPGCGEVGSLYPIMLRYGKDESSYIGHYKIMSREHVPVKEWKQWPYTRRLAIAKDVLATGWGKDLLLKRRLKLDWDTLKENPAVEVLGYFEKETEPNLRMSYTILRLAEFRTKDYETLVSAYRDQGKHPPPTTRPKNAPSLPPLSLEQCYDAAVTQWLDSEYKIPTPLIDDQLYDLGISTTQFKKLVSTIKSHYNQRASEAEDEIPNEPQDSIRIHKEHVSILAHTLVNSVNSDSFKSPRDVLRLFLVISKHFRNSNGGIDMRQSSRSSSSHEHPSRIAEKTPSKRRKSTNDDASRHHKRSKLSPVTALSKSASKVNERTRKSNLAIEILPNDTGTIFVDAQEKAKATVSQQKTIKMDTETTKEDLYGAPPPKRTARQRKSDSSEWAGFES